MILLPGPFGPANIRSPGWGIFGSIHLIRMIVPFFIFSGVAGQLADKFDKAFIASRLKLMEIPVAIIAAIGFLIPSVPLLFAALLCFGTLSAFFGPVKYGLLPVHLETRELPAGNALVEGATFLAILLGTIGGSFAASSDQHLKMVALSIVALAIGSWLTARMIPATGSAAPDLTIDRNIVSSTKTLLADLRGDTRIWQGALITSWFWVVGASPFVASGVFCRAVLVRVSAISGGRNEVRSSPAEKM